MDSVLPQLSALASGLRFSPARIGVPAIHHQRLPLASSQHSEPWGVTCGMPGMPAGVALGVGLAIGGRRGYRMRASVWRRCAGRDAPDTSKLQEYLDLAVEAEANDEKAEAIIQAEEKATNVVLLSKNGFQSFGKVVQAPKRSYTTQELKDEQINAAILLTTEDTVAGLRGRLLSFFTISGASLAIGFPALRPVVLVASAAILIALVVDLLLSRGVLQTLLLDILARVVNGEYANRVIQAEAARFMVAYLIGVLPKGYSLSAFEALSRFTSTSIKSGCVFCNAKLRKEVESSSLSSKSVDQLVCIKLAGVAQEYLMFQGAQSGAPNLEEIEDLFQALSFDKRRSDDQTRWAIINVIRLLRRHEKVHAELAKAMERNAPVGECISIIERLAPECNGTLVDTLMET